MSQTRTLSPNGCPPPTGRGPALRFLAKGTVPPRSGKAGEPDGQDLGPREHLLAASGELARALLAGQRPQDVLPLIAAHVRHGTRAPVVLVGSSTDGGWLLVEAAVGPDSDRLLGQSIRLPPVVAEGPILDPSGTSIAAPSPRPSSLALSLGSTPGGACRVLLLLGLPRTGRAAATAALRAFAEHTAQAFALADQRVAAEQERLLLDRDRTAGLLQELVIPHLFATGLRLAGTDGLLRDQPDQARVRLRQAVDDLDHAIAHVRTAAQGLRCDPVQLTDPTATLTALVAKGGVSGQPLAPLADLDARPVRLRAALGRVGAWQMAIRLDHPDVAAGVEGTRGREIDDALAARARLTRW